MNIRTNQKIRNKQASFVVVLIVFILFIIFDAMRPESISLADVTESKYNEQESLNATAAQEKGNAFEDRMKLYKERYKYTPPSPYPNDFNVSAYCGAAPDFPTFFSKSLNERSANSEDRDVYKLFFKEEEEEEEEIEKAKNGRLGNPSIVELGAFDGLRESNSHFFETCLGWDALLIEGNPRKWDKLKGNRPHAHRFSYVPTCTEEEEKANKVIKFDKAIFTNAGLADGSVETSYTKGNRTVDAPCGSFTNVLLDIFPKGHVTFFSLDVEGSEPAVVNNIDFGKVFIEVMMIESFNNYCPEKKFCKSREEYRKTMKDAGYIMFSGLIKKSDIFIHPKSKYLARVSQNATP